MGKSLFSTEVKGIMQHQPGLHVEKITIPDEFSALYNRANASAALWTNNIFLTRIWLERWWQVYGSDYHLHTLVVCDGEQVIGALPLVFRGDGWGAKRLTFMGAGELVPDDLDVLSIAERRADVLHALADYLHETRSEWDVLELDKLPADSLTLKEFESYFRSRGYLAEADVSAHCFYIDLPATDEEYLSRLSKPIYKNLVRRKRRLTCDYPGLEFLPVDSPAQIQQAFDALVQFHQARWTKRGYPGSFASSRFHEFHRLVILDAWQAGYLQLYSLRGGRSTIGVCYCYLVADTLQGYQYGFDESWSHYSIGSFMILQMIEKAILGGVRIFDFLEGDEEYKEDWATSVRENVRLRIYSRGWRGQLAYGKSRLARFAMEMGTRYLPKHIRRSAWKAYLRWRASYQRNKLQAQ